MLTLFDDAAMTGFTTVVFAVLAFARFGGAAVTGWKSPVQSTTKDVHGTVEKAVSENTPDPLDITFEAVAGTETNTEFTYMIKSQKPDGVFIIDTTTGSLSINTGHYLDYEAQTSHIVTVEAKVKDANAGEGIANVTILIADVDDTPTIDKSSYMVDIPDGSPKGTSVITMTATIGAMSAAGTKITSYKFNETSNSGSNFAIDATNGSITVNNELTGEGTANYVLVVKAVDNAKPPQTGSTTVNVCVGCQNGENVLSASLVLILASALFGVQQNL